MLKIGSRRFKCALLLLSIVVGMVSLPGASAAAPAWTNAWTTVTAASAPANPRAMAIDKSGNMYVTDGTRILKLGKQPNGTWNAQWEDLSSATTGLSAHPDSIAVDKNGNLYAADSAASVVQELSSGATSWVNIGGIQPCQVWVPGEWVLREYTMGGVPYWKQEWVDGYWTAGTSNTGTIWGPLGIAVDESLNVYVTNQGDYDSATYYHSCEKFTGGTWTVIGNQYSNNLYYIDSVATDTLGNVYVTTQYSSATRQGRDAIFKYSGGSWSQIGNTGNGTNMPVMPGSIAVDKWGNVYVVSHGDNTVKVFSGGQWTTVGGYQLGGPSSPSSVAVDSAGNVYVTDDLNNAVMELQAPATQLVWQTQPASGTAGQTWAAPPAVALVDGNGNVETKDSTHTVTLTLNNANGATLSNATVQLQNGVATFSSLAVSNVGSGFSLTPSCSLSAGLTAQPSNQFSMAVPSGPTVTSVSPATGVGGTKVTITGTNLLAASLVEFGDTAGVNLVVVDSTTVTVTAPTHAAGAVDIRVTTPGGKSPVNSPGDQFTFNPPGNWVGSWTTIGNSGSGIKSPNSIAVDQDLNLYEVDRDLANLMKRSPAGTWTSIAGTLSNAMGIAVDKNGNVYVADYGNSRVLKYNGGWTTIGDFGSVASPWYGLRPMSVAVDDNNGNVYTTGTCSGGKVLRWNGIAWSDVTGDGGFVLPYGVAVDSSGYLYVTDGDSTKNLVRKSINGGANWITIGSGLGTPSSVVVDSLGNVFVAENSYYGAIKELPVGSAAWQSIPGSGYYGGLFYTPKGVAVDKCGSLYAAGGAYSGGGSLVVVHQAPATQLTWRTQPGGGFAGQSMTPYPSLALKDAFGNTVTSDSGSTVTLSLYSNNGATLAGTTTVTLVNGIADFVDLRVDRVGSGYVLVPSSNLSGITLPSSDAFSISEAPAPPAPIAWTGGWTDIGGGSVFQNAYGVAVDDNLHVYVVDNSKPFVDSNQWGSVKNWIGETSPITWYNVGTPALRSPSGIAVKTSAGTTTVYVADTTNYRVTYGGATLGGGFYSYFMPNGVAVDQNGNVYAVGNNAPIYLLKWNGNAWSNISYHGPFNNPVGVAVDGSGNLYVADKGKKEVYMMPVGTTQWKTIGTGFSDPNGIAVDGWGNVYITDGHDGGVVKALQAGRTNWVTLPGGIWGVQGVGVDKNGRIYVAFNSYVYTRPAPATQLAWQTQPGGGTGGMAWAQQPVLRLLDANGSVAADSSSQVTVSLVDATGATLSGTTQVTLQNGVASLANLKVDKAGTYKLVATCAGLTSAESSAFTVTAGAASKLTWQSQPSDGQSGQLLPKQPILRLEDAGGNLISSDSTSSVTVALTTPNGATLSGVKTGTLDAGVASFAGLSIDKTGSYTLTVTTSLAGISTQASAAFTVAPGPASQLVWQTQPGGGTGGTAWSQQPVLHLKDANGNTVAGDSASTVTLSLVNANSATLLSEKKHTVLTVKNGVASFGDLAVDKIGTYQLAAVSSLPGITSPQSDQFAVTVGPAKKLQWQVQPGGGPSGQAWAQQPVLYLQDAGGNLVTGDSASTVTIALTNANGATLDGPKTVTLQGGVATFAGLTINKSGKYTLAPASSLADITSPVSAEFTIAAGAASKLVWDTQPGGGTGGTVWAQQPVLRLEDAFGNVKTDDSTSTVTLALKDADGNDDNLGGAALSGATQVTLQNGVATFTGLKVNKVGTYILMPSISSAGIECPLSGQFQVTLGSAAALVWDIQPAGGECGSVLTTQPILFVVDAGGNVRVGDNTSQVSVAVAPAIVLGGDTAVTTQDGKATFTNLSMNTAGTYTLTATCGGLTSDSQQFTMSPDDSSIQLVWQAQPGGGTGGSAWAQQPVLALEDGFGNVFTDDSATKVTVVLSDPGANNGALSGTATATAQSGVASFAGLSVNKIGDYALAASCDRYGVAASTSNTFTISTGPAAMLEWKTQPVGDTADEALAAQPALQLVDAGGNAVDDDASEVTLSLVNAGGAALTGANPVTVLNGLAQFDGLEVHTAGTYTLTASSGPITSAASDFFTISPGAATQLIWQTQPGGAEAGLALNPKPKVALADQYGNVVLGDNTSTVAVSLTVAGTSTLSGTNSLPLQAGVAEFAGLSVDKAGKYTLTATCGALTRASNEFTITSGAVSVGHSTIVASKSPVVANATDSSTVTVTLRDAYDNPVAGKAVTLSQGSGSSDVTAVQGTSDAEGIAVFTVTSTKAEDVVYSAVVDTKPATGSVTVSLVHGPVKKLQVVAPGAPVAGTPFSVTVTAQDEYGNTVKDYLGTIEFSTDNGTSPETPLLPANQAFIAGDKGTRTFTGGVTLYRAATSTITATDVAVPTITGTAVGIIVGPGAVDYQASQVVANPATVTANGTAGSITVTIVDAYGNPVSDRVIMLTPLNGSSIVTAVNGTTDNTGKASFEVKSTTAEDVVYTASVVNGQSLSSDVTVRFVPGVLNGLDVSTGLTQTAGAAFSVTVRATDANGNVIKDYSGTVSMSVGHGNSPDGTSPVLPEASHAFTAGDEGSFTFSGVKIYKATTSMLVVTDTVNATSIQIAVVPGPVSPGDSTLVPVGGKQTVVAGESDSASITATVKDEYGNPIQGVAVTLAQGSGSSSAIAPASATSNASGDAAFTVKSTKAEVVTYTASAGGTALSAAVQVEFAAGAVDASISTVTAGKPFVAANGTDTSTITVTLKDQYGNPVSGRTVSLSQSVGQDSGHSTINAVTSTTGPDGRAVFTVSDSTKETVTYTAISDAGTANEVGIAQGAVVTFAEPHSVSVSAAPPEGGTASGGGVYGEGASVTVTAVADGAYEFDGWTETTVVGNVEQTASVSANASYTFQLGAADRTLTANFLKKTHALTIAAGSGGSITNGTSGDYASGAVINITAKPSSRYTFVKWTSSGGGSFGNATAVSTTFTMPANDVTVTASFERVEESDTGDSGGNPPTPPTPPKPNYTAVVTGGGAGGTGGSGDGASTLNLDVDSDSGTVAVNLGEQAKGFFEPDNPTVITVPPIEGTKAYSLDLPAATLTDSSGAGEVTLSTSVGSVTIPANMLVGSDGADGGSNGAAAEASISIGEVDKTALPEEVKQVIGDRPVVQLSLTINKRQAEWNNPDAPVTVSISYTPTPEELESPENIVVWYVDGQGNVISVPSGRYDPATGKVTFTTTHFSCYAVAFVQKSFGDLASTEWARKSIEVLASKGIIQGTSATTYSPEANITRADFLVLLSKTLGFTAKPGVSFGDVLPGTYYYDAVGAAKALGIVTGTGDNLFGPDESITRQDMMVMTARALSKMIGSTAAGDVSTLASFADRADVAEYAAGPLSALIQAGLVKGSGDRLEPCGLTTRAEAAVFLYRVYLH